MVKEIIGHEIDKNTCDQVWYKIRWDGYNSDGDTFENKENLC